MTKQGPFQAGGCSKFFMVIYQVNRREKNMMISINAWGKKKKTFDKIQCSFQNIWESRNRITKENVIWPKRASLNLQLTSSSPIRLPGFYSQDFSTAKFTSRQLCVSVIRVVAINKSTHCGYASCKEEEHQWRCHSSVANHIIWIFTKTSLIIGSRLLQT